MRIEAIRAIGQLGGATITGAIEKELASLDRDYPRMPEREFTDACYGLGEVVGAAPSPRFMRLIGAWKTRIKDDDRGTVWIDELIDQCRAAGR